MGGACRRYPSGRVRNPRQEPACGAANTRRRAIRGSGRAERRDRRVQPGEHPVAADGHKRVEQRWRGGTAGRRHGPRRTGRPPSSRAPPPAPAAAAPARPPRNRQRSASAITARAAVRPSTVVAASQRLGTNRAGLLTRRRSRNTKSTSGPMADSNGNRSRTIGSSEVTSSAVGTRPEPPRPAASARWSPGTGSTLSARSASDSRLFHWPLIYSSARGRTRRQSFGTGSRPNCSTSSSSVNRSSSPRPTTSPAAPGSSGTPRG